MTEKVQIRYGDVALGAKDDFVAETTDKTDFTNFDLFKVNTSFPNYGNPCELYTVPLDDSIVPIPEDTAIAALGWWSESITQEDMTFATPITLILSASKTYRSIGLTIDFDSQGDIFPTDVKIKWTNGSTVTAEKEYNPDEAKYFFKLDTAVSFDRIEIVFRAMNLPYTRLRVHSIDYGYGAMFSGEELKNVTVNQSISPISTEIEISTVEFTIYSKQDINFSFQQKQPIELYYSGKLRAKTFVREATRQSRYVWSVKSEDYIAILEDTPYEGFVSMSGANAKEVIADIMAAANVPYTIETTAFDEAIVKGRIPYTNCREALMQVAFAIGAVVTAADRGYVAILELPQEADKSVSLDDIMQGQSFNTSSQITSVEVTAHAYAEQEGEIEGIREELYSAANSGGGNNLLIIFDEPCYGIFMTGTFESLGGSANHWYGNVGDDFVLYGVKYRHETSVRRKQNPNITAQTAQNIASITEATLVSSNNVDKVLERCYNYLSKTDTTSMRIVEREKEEPAPSLQAIYGRVRYGQTKYGEGLARSTRLTAGETISIGDCINYGTEYLGTKQGTVIEQSYNLNGGIIVKDVKVR